MVKYPSDSQDCGHMPLLYTCKSGIIQSLSKQGWVKSVSNTHYQPSLPYVLGQQRSHPPVAPRQKHKPTSLAHTIAKPR